MVKKNIIRNILVLLGLLIVVVLLYLFRDCAGGVEQKQWKALDEKDVATVEVSNQKGTYTLEKEDQQWLIMPEEYVLDREAMSNFLETITSERTFSLYDSDPFLTGYGLDKDRAAHVILKAGDGSIVRELYIGEKESGPVFVRFADSKTVFQTFQSISSMTGKGKTSLSRETDIFSVSKNDITKVILTNTETTGVFSIHVSQAEDGTEERYWNDDSGSSELSDLVQNIVDEMSILDAAEMTDIRKEDLQKETAKYSATLQTAADDYTVTITNKKAGEGPDGNYIAYTPARGYGFSVTANFYNLFAENADKLF